jgi:pyridoxamine 5'-phosphate oxidase
VRLRTRSSRGGARPRAMFCAVDSAPRQGDRERALDVGDLAPTWHGQLERWLAEATAAGVAEPTAMVLATADEAGAPSARTVLLKDLSAGGLAFYTNLGSRKGQDIAANPRAAIVFPWFAIGRQVVATGVVEPVEADAADAYFASRAYRSQISAHASRQSRVIRDRASLEAAHAEFSERYPASIAVPRPTDWGGFRVLPSAVEFWHGRADRLHDRLRFRLDGDGDWLVERLSP